MVGLDNLTPESAEVVLKVVEELRNTGSSPTYQKLVLADYVREPVDPEVFLFDPYYMGRIGKNLYSKWIDELLYILDPVNGVHELILTGAIGVGKSTVAAVALSYKLYQLSCMRSPSSYYGLMEGTPILFGIYNVYKYKAEDNYSILKTFIEHSPYFIENYPTLKMRNRSARDGLYFDNGVYVVSGSTELHALGLNLFSLTLDEVNFMRVPNNRSSSVLSQAQRLYTASKSRMESRYMYRGAVPGLMIIISSRNVETSWLENHIKEVRDKPGVRICDYAIWDVKRDVMGYSGKKFRVEVGDGFSGSRILKDGEEANITGRVVEVPIEHLQSFEVDPDVALRDLGGIASIPHSVFIRQREHVNACINKNMKHPFTKESIVISDKLPVKIQDFLKWRELVEVRNSIVRPRINPAAVRHVHVDLALTGCAAGFCMGHVSDVFGSSPRMKIDFMLRIQSPKQGQIDFSKIRDFIVYLKDNLGYLIKSVSFDTFQSADSKQILEKLGFETHYISVDKSDEAYKTARDVVYEHRVEFYEYPPFISEFLGLLYDGERQKVILDDKGTKDVSDAFASVVFFLSRAIGRDKGLGRVREARELLPMMGSQIDMLGGLGVTRA